MKLYKRAYSLAALIPVAVFMGCSDDAGPTGGDDAGGNSQMDGGAADAEVVPSMSPESPVGRWTTRDLSSSNTRNVVDEKIISPATVSQLKAQWTLTGYPGGMTSSLQVFDGVAYFGNWANVVSAVKASSGELVWKTNKLDCNAGTGLRATGAVTEERFYIGCGGSLYALDRSDGHTIWQSKFDKQELAYVDASPKFAGDLIIISSANLQESRTATSQGGHGTMAAIRADGTVAWTLDLSEGGDGVSIWSSVAVDEKRKLIFFGTGNSFTAPGSKYSDAVVAVSYETGKIQWATQYTKGDVFTSAGQGPGPDSDVGTDPNLFTLGDQDVVSAGSKGGIFKVLDRDTGKEVWSVTIGVGSSLGGVHATAAVDDDNDRIYVTSNTWTRFGIAISGKNDPGDTSDLYALDAANKGAILWKKRLDAPCLGGGMTLANGMVFSTTVKGSIYAHAASDGAELWKTSLGYDQATAVTIVDGWLFTGGGMTFLRSPTQTRGGMARAFAIR